MIDGINSDLKKAMLAGDSLKVDVLKGLKSSVTNQQIDSKEELGDTDIQKIIQKEIKKRQEAAEIYLSAGENSRAEKEEKEAEILRVYLPQQMTDQEIEAIVDKIIKEKNVESPKQMGMVIGLAVKEVGTRGDSAKIAEITKKKLSSG